MSGPTESSLAAAILITAACLIPFGFAQAEENSRGVLTVEVSGFENSNGRVRAGLFESNDRFPLGVDDVSTHVESTIEDGKATLEFESLAHGTYAVVVYHDANANGSLDKNFFGMPTEGAGIYRPVDSRFPPPTFADCAFQFDEASRTVGVELNYL